MEITIRGKKLTVPILQGGMGVGVSLERLAGAVASCGGMGTISTAMCGYNEPDYEKDSFGANLRALTRQIKKAKENDRPVIVLCGRPYHLDEEINHGIDKLICECGATVITEDSVSPLVEKFPTTVLNQWTYHSRLYAAAKYVAKANDKDLNVVQLVSFGCGVDAITTDEMRTILEKDGKIYTQIKIDEISNPGAVKIRLRSLFAATGR